MRPPSDEPGIPLTFHPLSNGEYAPLPRSALIDETIRRTLELADRNARRTGLDRRAFLRRATGTAAVLATLAACSEEQRAASTSSSSSSSSSSTTSSTTSPHISGHISGHGWNIHPATGVHDRRGGGHHRAVGPGR